MTAASRTLVIAALLAALGAPAMAEMGPDMTCLDFTSLLVGDDKQGQTDATKMLKEAAAAQGILPEKLAQTQSVESLRIAINARCETRPDMRAMDAMLEGN